MSKKQSKKNKLLIAVIVSIFTLSITSIVMATLSIKELISENVNKPDSISKNDQSTMYVIDNARNTVFFSPWETDMVIDNQMQLEQLILNEPNNPDAKAALAENIILQSYISYDNYVEKNFIIAQDLLDQAFEIDPNSLTAYDIQIGLHLKMNEFSEAEQILTRAKEFHPDTLLLIGHELEILNKTGKPQQAVNIATKTLTETDDLQAKINIHSKLVDSHARLGGNCQKMIGSLENVVELQPENPWMLINLADLSLQCTFDWEKVIDLASRSLEVADIPMAHVILAKGYHKQGELLSFKNEKDAAR